MAKTPHLSARFVEQLKCDGFQEIGYYEISEGNDFRIQTDAEARNWEFSVYGYVSYADGGKLVRIGRSEGPLRKRLSGWSRNVGDALSVTMQCNQTYSGGTPPLGGAGVA